MSFQLKDFAAITGSMIARARATQDKITDFNVGSVARTLMEAPAVEIEELYQRMFAGIMDAIPVAIYRGFEFDLLEPAKAMGTVNVHFVNPLVDPVTFKAGAAFTSSSKGTRYFVLEEVIAPVGATSAAIIIRAERAGAAYNLPANALDETQGIELPTGATFTSDPITSGADGENEIQRASRFAEFIQSISKGTVQSVKFAAASAKLTDEDGVVYEYVTRVGVDETPGEVQIFIYGAGQPASSGLIAQAQKLVDGYWDGAQFVPGYRPVGVSVLVLPMVEQDFDVAFKVSMLPGLAFGPSVGNEIISRVSALLDKAGPGEVLLASAVRDAALAAAGIATIQHDLGENVVCPRNAVLVPGAITFEAE